MKHDIFTPKAIAKRMKAKSRQKLKLYCPPCKKQCRDDNGFKCHCMSEGHMRNMELVGHDVQGYMDESSRDFMDAFLVSLKLHGRNARVEANRVYNEYIGNRHSTHMTSTRWATLSEFVSFLGRIGKCRVDVTEKGPFLVYNDGHEVSCRDSRNPKRMGEEDRREREVRLQIQRALAIDSSAELDHDALEDVHQNIAPTAISTSIDRKHADQGISFSLRCPVKPSLIKEFSVGDQYGHDTWLYEGIVVKVISRRTTAGGVCFYKTKGVLRKVVAGSVGEVEMLQTGDVLEADQDELETVIPQIGGMVRLVRGVYRGSVAVLLSIDVVAFKAQVQVIEGIFTGRILDAVDYEDICKLASSECK